MKRSSAFVTVRSLLLFSLLIISKSTFAQYPGDFPEKNKVAVKVPLKAYSFNLDDVSLLDGPFKQNMERDGKWLATMDINRLLHSFRVNAGIETNAQELGGWERLDCELRGHTTGHVLSALAMMYASTGNVLYKNRGDSIVAALAEVQKAINQDGYVSAYPQNLVDRAIAGKPVWAPWYTLHKIYAGLFDMYMYTGNQQALAVLNNASVWAYKKLSPLTADQLAVMERTEFGGMAEVFYNLYGITGNEKHKQLAEFFYHKKVLDALAAGTDQLKGLHANTNIPKIIGEARGYELTGDDKDKNIAEFFWQTVIANHTYATGGNSESEFFFEPGKLSEHMGVRTTETCNTYNMLKLTRHLFTWTADIKYADYYERALYNHILTSQDPETGMQSYFMPFKPGSFKIYSTPTNSFWCCVGTGFESNSKYGEGIYYHSDNGVYVNLFIPSVLNWKDKGVKITQETKYPEEETTRLTISTDKVISMPLYIRYPSWATSGATVTVNGKKVKIAEKPGSYITLNRKWKNGDKIEVTYPMSLRLVPTPDDPKKVAVAYGPVILVGAMGTEGMTDKTPYANDQNDLNNYEIPANIVHTLNTNGAKVSDWLKPVGNGNPLTFETASGGTDKITLVPYYRLYNQRYVIYWDLK